MKKISTLLIIIGIILTACFKTEVPPPLMFDGEANMTIAEFKTLHEFGTGPATLIEDDVIITGIVTSTDQFGSCYQELFFQDNSGGISLKLLSTPYYAKYPVGLRIFVKAKGLYLGNYVSGSGNTGYYQIGLYGNANGGMEKIPAEMENKHIFRHGLPGDPLVPKPIKTVSEITDEDFYTVIQLVNCKFTNGGKTKFYEESLDVGGQANQNIEFNTGTGTIIARINSRCSFANEMLPANALNITGLLTKFNNDKQFIICSINDVIILPPEKILKDFDMSTNPLEAGWTNKKIKGETVWTYATGSQNSVRIQAPAGDESECWLVSPKFNFAGEKDVALSFSYRTLNGGTNDNFKVKYSVDGSNWIDFALEIAGNSEITVKISDHIATNPNLQIAFQYKTTEVYPTWAISKIVFKGNVL